MKVIWKFHIQGAIKEFDGPAGAKPLCVQLQNGNPEMWLLADHGAPPAKHRVMLVATGQHFQEDVGDYVGTLQFHNDTIVLHVFHKQLGVIVPS